MKTTDIKRIAILSAMLFMMGLSVSAQTNQETPYKLLAPLPCIGDSCGSLTEETVLSKYLPGIFKLAVGLSAAFAVLMIVVGGFQYMSSDAFQNKKEGLERVQNAVKGLILVIGAGLILSEINPELLELKLSLSPVTIQAPAGSGGGTLGGEGGLQPITQNAWNDLKNQCAGCNLTQTSTTGGQHNPGSLHYQGLAVDIAPNTGLNQFLTGSANNPTPCRKVNKTLAGQTVSFLWEPSGAKCGGTVASSGDHWHMSIPQ